jgi:hypothetical protein
VPLLLGVSVASCASGPSQQSYLDQIYQPGRDDAFGAQTQDQIVQAARMRADAPLTAEQQRSLDQAYRTGQNNDFGAGQTQQPVLAQRDYQSRLAAGVPMVGGKPDLVGNGGPQDNLAREIYTPGHDITEMLGGGG